MTAADRQEPLVEVSAEEEGRERTQSGERKRETLAFGEQKAVVLVAHENVDLAHAIALELDARNHTAFLVATTDEVLTRAVILRPHALVCSEQLPGLDNVEMRHAIGDAVGDPRRTAVIFIGEQSGRGVLAESETVAVADAVEASLRRRKSSPGA